MSITLLSLHLNLAFGDFISYNLLFCHCLGVTRKIGIRGEYNNSFIKSAMQYTLMWYHTAIRYKIILINL